MSQPATYAAGVRRPYRDLPERVRAWVDEVLGEPVATVADKRGGFSPGVAAVVTGASGRSLFIKAVGSAVNPDAIRMYQEEQQHSARLPDIEFIPRTVAVAELAVGEERYAVSALPAIDAAPPPHPWRLADANRAFDTIAELGDRLTPSPWSDAVDRTDGADGPGGELDRFYSGWRRQAEQDQDPWREDPWIGPRLSRFAELEARTVELMSGDTLSHTDLRADNLLFGDDRVWVVDWAAAQNAARWVDPVILLADLVVSRADRGDGGEIDIARFAVEHPALKGVDFELTWAGVCLLAGALHRMSLLPDPPGLPTIRPWQSQCADTMITWCRRTEP
ncbi:phosphotransferase [Microlunatus speluncae]|uniref:phosphotransferase n=1 Tax=Microlunatus speluncae TaxID=2594267 RepID=UPI0012660CDF|nr:phosphotransferase [Microlunatus speluncae]